MLLNRLYGFDYSSSVFLTGFQYKYFRYSACCVNIEGEAQRHAVIVVDHVDIFMD